MKILFTGGQGFVGGTCINYLLDKYPNLKIEDIDCNTYAVQYPYTRDRYTQHTVTLTNKHWVREVVRKVKPDLVIHMASESHVDNSISDPRPFVDTNVVGMLNLLEACREFDVQRIIHMSTDEVLAHDGRPVDENGDDHQRTFEDSRFGIPGFHTSSMYSATKAAQEHMCEAYRRTHGMWIQTIRCCNMYGPRQNTEKFIPKAMTDALAGRTIKVYGKGLQKRQWLFVRDFAEALDDIINMPVSTEVYHVSGDLPPFRNKVMANKIAALTGAELEFITDRPGHDEVYNLDSTNLRAASGWRARTSLEDGLNETLEFYKSKVV